MRRIQLNSRRLVTGDLLGQFRSAFRGTGLVYRDIRLYQPGDDVKHIHWKATARTGHAYVKSFEEDRQLRVILAVDASASMRAPHNDQAHTRALEFSGLIGALTLRSNDLLGLSMFAEHSLLHLPPKSGLSRSRQVISALAYGEHHGVRTDLAKAFEELRMTVHKPSLIFVISDFIAPPFEEELQRLAARHDVILVNIEPRVGSIPALGLVTYRDAESGETIVIDTASKKVRAAWESMLAERNDAFAELASRCRADHIFLHDDVTTPLVRLMRERSRRGAR